MPLIVGWLSNLKNMNEAQQFSERLKQSMIQAGYVVRPVVLEREFNQHYWGTPVTAQAVRKWLHGEVIPTQDKLQALAEWLRVDPHWLRFGERLFGSVQEQRATYEASMTPEDRALVTSLMGLPIDKRKLLFEVVRAFQAQCQLADSQIILERSEKS